MIEFFFENIEPFTLPKNIGRWIIDIIVSEDKKAGPITYIFCDDDYLLSINKQYLEHDYFTDIITFDYVKGKIISGDIFVSLPRISENAEEHNDCFDNELLRVLAHGVLHLCGYGDKSPAEQQLMRMKENQCIARYRQILSGI